MDYETVSAEDFGRSLRGIGVNLLVRDVLATCDFVQQVLGAVAHRKSADFAIIALGDQVFQLHSDGTYHANPLLSLLPENPPRGAGVEIRLYDVNPEDAVARAHRFEAATVLQEPTDKPHGLVEAYILCQDGYAWVPSRAI